MFCNYAHQNTGVNKKHSYLAFTFFSGSKEQEEPFNQLGNWLHEGNFWSSWLWKQGRGYGEPCVWDIPCVGLTNVLFRWIIAFSQPDISLSVTPQILQISKFVFWKKAFSFIEGIELAIALKDHEGLAVWLFKDWEKVPSDP
jgi:hypothetical protein